MPELPEVETIARALREGGQQAPAGRQAQPVVGRTVEHAHVLWDRTIAAPGPEEFPGRILGQRFESLHRRGKFLVFQLTRDQMLVHLRMSGDLLVELSGTPYGRHHRLVLDLDGGMRLSFQDARKFGRVWLLDDPAPVLGGLGPEPLKPGFTAEALHKGLQSRRRQLKPLLMDQSFLAGLGNIYTDEALFVSGLHPLRLSNSITFEEAGRLWKAIRQVLRAGIQQNGASIDWVYRGGGYQSEFQVYRRTGKPCPRCGNPVERFVVGQRATHICPQCQPALDSIA